MRKATASILLTLILTASNDASAQTEASDHVWYGALKTSMGYATIDNITDRNTIGTGAVIDMSVDGQIEDAEVDDYTAGIGFAVGRRLGYWSLSAEYIWRYRTDWDIVAPTPSIQSVTNIFSNVETTTLLLNLTRRGTITPYWSWEVGAGIGLVANDIESEYIEREVPGIRPEQKFKDANSDVEFTYNVFVGVTRDLGGPWTLNFRLRHIDLGDLKAGPFPNRASRGYGEHSSQELQFSLERDF